MPYLKVSFYNEEHQALLRTNSSKYENLVKLTQQGFHCSNEDLWTYGLFREQKNIFGFRTFRELKGKFPRQWQHVKDYFVLDDETVRAKYEGSELQDKILTETLGIGAGLAIISHIHNLTQADWNLIRVSKEKDLDFYISSDGNQKIAIEAKGRYVEENTKIPSISSAKSDIEKKKKQQRSKDNRNIMYGVITSYSSNPDTLAHSRILDPPIQFDDEEPQKLKLLSRLSFYLQQLNLLSRSSFLIALANRVRDIQILNDYQSLNRLPLLNQLGERFEFPSSYTSARTIILNKSGFGEVFPVSANQFFFFGLESIIVNKLISQNFSAILEHRAQIPNAFDVENIEAKIKTQDLNEYQINYDNFRQVSNERRVIMNLSGRLHSNSAGIIFGHLSAVGSGSGN